MIILLDRESVSAYHWYGLIYTVADCSWQGSEQDSWAGVDSAGLYLIHCSVPRYDGSYSCICLLTGWEVITGKIAVHTGEICYAVILRK
jgi:hypothetical protein